MSRCKCSDSHTNTKDMRLVPHPIITVESSITWRGASSPITEFLNTGTSPTINPMICKKAILLITIQFLNVHYLQRFKRPCCFCLLLYNKKLLSQKDIQENTLPTITNTDIKCLTSTIKTKR